MYIFWICNCNRSNSREPALRLMKPHFHWNLSSLMDIRFRRMETTRNTFLHWSLCMNEDRCIFVHSQSRRRLMILCNGTEAYHLHDCKLLMKIWPCTIELEFSNSFLSNMFRHVITILIQLKLLSLIWVITHLDPCICLWQCLIDFQMCPYSNTQKTYLVCSSIL